MNNCIKIIMFGTLVLMFACSPSQLLFPDKVYDENYAGYVNNFSNSEARNIYKQIIADNLITESEFDQLCRILIGKSQNEVQQICGHPISGSVYREPNPPSKASRQEKMEYWLKTDSAVMGYELFYVYFNRHKEAISVHLGKYKK